MPFAGCQLLLQPVQQQGTVGQPGQPVIVRHPLKLKLRSPELGKVLLQLPVGSLQRRPALRFLGPAV